MIIRCLKLEVQSKGKNGQVRAKKRSKQDEEIKIG